MIIIALNVKKLETFMKVIPILYSQLNDDLKRIDHVKILVNVECSFIPKWLQLTFKNQ